MMDPTRMLFAQQERPLRDDDDNRGLNCHGCLFHRQPASVCRVAGIEAVSAVCGTAIPWTSSAKW